MADAREAAPSAHADAVRPYPEAAPARDACGWLQRDEFAVATQKFLESRDGYERARRAAETAGAPSRAPAPHARAAGRPGRRRGGRRADLGSRHPHGARAAHAGARARPLPWWPTTSRPSAA